MKYLSLRLLKVYILTTLYSLVVPQGFEPRLDGPKPPVLPLHNGTITVLFFSDAKIKRKYFLTIERWNLFQLFFIQY